MHCAAAAAAARHHTHVSQIIWMAFIFVHTKTIAISSNWVASEWPHVLVECVCVSVVYRSTMHTTGIFYAIRHFPFHKICGAVYDFEHLLYIGSGRHFRFSFCFCSFFFYVIDFGRLFALSIARRRRHRRRHHRMGRVIHMRCKFSTCAVCTQTGARFSQNYWSREKRRKLSRTKVHSPIMTSQTRYNKLIIKYE